MVFLNNTRYFINYSCFYSPRLEMEKRKFLRVRARAHETPTGQDTKMKMERPRKKNLFELFESKLDIQTRIYIDVDKLYLKLIREHIQLLAVN